MGMDDVMGMWSGGGVSVRWLHRDIRVGWEA